MDKSYMEAVERKLAKKGCSENEIRREINKICGIKEPIVIKTKKDGGLESNKDGAGLAGGKTVEGLSSGKTV